MNEAALGENHKRAVSTTLALLDKALWEFGHWARGHGVRSVLYEIRNTLSQDQRGIIAAEVAEMKTILGELQSALELERSVRSVDKMILGSFQPSGPHWRSLKATASGDMARSRKAWPNTWNPGSLQCTSG